MGTTTKKRKNLIKTIPFLSAQSLKERQKRIDNYLRKATGGDLPLKQGYACQRACHSRLGN